MQGLRMKRTKDSYEKKEPQITQIFTDMALSFFKFPVWKSVQSADNPLMRMPCSSTYTYKR